MGVAWNGNNIGGATKRAVGIAMHVGFGNLGGVIAGFSFRSKDAPRYFSGHGLLIGTVTMSLFLCIFMHIYLVRENSRRDIEMAARGLTLDSYTEEMKYEEREKGDDATVSEFLSVNLNPNAYSSLSHFSSSALQSKNLASRFSNDAFLPFSSFTSALFHADSKASTFLILFWTLYEIRAYDIEGGLM